jgi:hypothetical protein
MKGQPFFLNLVSTLNSMLHCVCNGVLSIKSDYIYTEQNVHNK